jgi:Gas vesicle protein
MSKRKKKDEILDEREVSLLDLVDNVLNRGVVLTGEIILGVADVDLVYVRLAAILCAADRLFPPKK